MTRALVLALLGLHGVGCYHFAQLAHAVKSRRDSAAPSVYAERCSSCHGDEGRGDGLAGRSLDPAPRDFTDPVWQAGASDERIRSVIRRGGAASGLSASMAAHADLSGDDLDALVAYIRGRQR
jgi:mono/diheme cytochrome c family protein